MYLEGRFLIPVLPFIINTNVVLLSPHYLTPYLVSRFLKGQCFLTLSLFPLLFLLICYPIYDYFKSFTLRHFFPSSIIFTLLPPHHRIESLLRSLLPYVITIHVTHPPHLQHSTTLYISPGDGLLSA